MRKLKDHAGAAALLVAVMALMVALTGFAGALPGSERKAPKVKVVQRTATLGPVASGASGDAVAKCNAGEKAVGGGFSIANAPEPEVEGYETHPSPTTDGSTPTGWTTLFTITGIPHTVSTYVICASP